MNDGKSNYMFSTGILLDASRTIHGYHMHNSVGKLLGYLNRNISRWMEENLIDKYHNPLDVTLSNYYIDSDLVRDLCGFYSFIYLSHRRANHLVSSKKFQKRPLVTLLRSFDPQEIYHMGKGLGVGLRGKIKEIPFRYDLEKYLFENHLLARVMSPEDHYWDTIDIVPYLRFDFYGMLKVINNRSAAYYTNCNNWMEVIRKLCDMSDVIIVYIEKITPSVVWELELLRSMQRQDEVLIVYSDAIDVERGPVDERIAEGFRSMGGELVWDTGKSKSNFETVDAFFEYFSDFSEVHEEEEFLGHLDLYLSQSEVTKIHRKTIRSKKRIIDYKFQPCVSNDIIKQIESFSNLTENRIQFAVSNNSMAFAPYYANLTQYLLIANILIGNHGGAGRSLAYYSGIAKSYIYFIDKFLLNHPDITDDHLHYWNEQYQYIDHAQDLTHHIAVFMTQFDKSFSESKKIIERIIGKTNSSLNNLIDRFYSLP